MLKKYANYFKLKSNIIGRTYMTINDHENSHFDNALDIQMSSENHEKNGYGLDLEMLTILY